MVNAATIVTSLGQGQSTALVSVVMPVFNGERFLAESLDSVLTQSLSDFELIVVDDGSVDSSPRIVDEYASRDPRVIVDRESHQGAAVAANRGIALASAPLVAILDSDDVAMPDRLERQHRFLSEHGETAVVGGGVRFTDDSGRAFADVQYPLTDEAIREAFAYTTPVAQPAAMFRKQPFERVGGYRQCFEPAADLDLWLRIGERYRFANLPELLVSYRIHAQQLTVRKLERQALCTVAARVAARARLAALPDPFDNGGPITEETLIEAGAEPEEITATFVRSATWLAKTMERAGYSDSADQVFADADARARSDSGSSELVAMVQRARTPETLSARQRLRERLAAVRAAIASPGS